ncbi:MAG: DMT family transporter [Crocinitomicaceae bacterium]|nr:DMT family transporter [Crocinitomicaceae bacterium]
MTRALAHTALALVATIYGANFIIVKSVMPDPIGPNSFILMRVLGAAILFWLIAFRRIEMPRKADLSRFILCGLTGVAVNQLLFFNGLALTSPINGAIIMTSNPILVMIISSVMFGYTINAMKITGVMLGAAGAVLLLLQSTIDHTQASSTLGDFYVLVNSLSYAFFLVLVKPLMRSYKPMTVITWVFTIGLLAVAPFGRLGLSNINWEALTAWQWFSIFFVIVFVTFLTYLLNIIALAVVTPTTASAYTYLQPILAGLFSFLFSIWLEKDFTSDITPAKIGCMLLIFAGVYLVGRSELKAKGQS